MSFSLEHMSLRMLPEIHKLHSHEFVNSRINNKQRKPRNIEPTNIGTFYSMTHSGLSKHLLVSGALFVHGLPIMYLGNDKEQCVILQFLYIVSIRYDYNSKIIDSTCYLCNR